MQEEEININELEQKLDKLIKLCGNVVDSGKTYVAQQRLDFFLKLTNEFDSRRDVFFSVYLQMVCGTWADISKMIIRLSYLYES